MTEQVPVCPYSWTGYVGEHAHHCMYAPGEHLQHHCMCGSIMTTEEL